MFGVEDVGELINPYGMTRAPRRAMESPVALWPESFGMNIPSAIPLAGGFAKLISPKKQPAITNTRIAINSSSFLTYKATYIEI